MSHEGNRDPKEQEQQDQREGLEGRGAQGAQEVAGAAAAGAARAVGISKVYGAGDTEVRALDGVTVAFPVGRFTAVMGPSGSGKTDIGL